MKKVLVLTLSALLVLTMFTACGTKETAKETTIPSTQKESTTYDDRLPADVPLSTENKQNTDVSIDKEEAKNIVLSHAGLKETEISRYRIELDRERKTLVYEIDFTSGEYEYDYEVNAETGKIIRSEKEYRD